MSRRNNRPINRRQMLRGASTAAVTAASLTVTGSEEAQAYNPGERETAARYRETDHVKAFYRTNGYETLKK